MDTLKRFGARIYEAALDLYDVVVREPVAIRGAVAAVVNVLILSGVVGAPFGEDADKVVEGIILAATNLGLLVAARAKVTPVADAHLGAVFAAALK